MKNVVVDTYILINFLRGKKSAKDFLLSLVEDSTIYCSAITAAVLATGNGKHYPMPDIEKTIVSTS